MSPRRHRPRSLPQAAHGAHLPASPCSLSFWSLPSSCPVSLRSSYPSKRTFKDEEGHYRGVAGSVELLNSRVLSTQPMVSLDWSRDMIGLACAACLDQTLRVYIVTKLDKL